MSGQRSIATAIGVVATVLLVWMVNPWFAVPEGLSQVVTIAFWVLAVALVIVLYMDARRDPASDQVEIEGPGFVRFLFGNSRAATIAYTGAAGTVENTVSESVVWPPVAPR